MFRFLFRGLVDSAWASSVSQRNRAAELPQRYFFSLPEFLEVAILPSLLAVVCDFHSVQNIHGDGIAKRRDGERGPPGLR